MIGYNFPYAFEHWGDGAEALMPQFTDSTLGSLPHKVPCKLLIQAANAFMQAWHRPCRHLLRKERSWYHANSAQEDDSMCAFLPCYHVSTTEDVMPMQMDLGASEFHHCYEFFKKVGGLRRRPAQAAAAQEDDENDTATETD